MVTSPKGFFASLYDLSFHAFVTPKIIQIVYLIALTLAALWALGFLISGFLPSYGFLGAQAPSFGGILLHIIAAPIIFVLCSLGARIYLEFIVAVFRIAENTASLRKME